MLTIFKIYFLYVLYFSRMLTVILFILQRDFSWEDKFYICKIKFFYFAMFFIIFIWIKYIIIVMLYSLLFLFK